ncbi:PAS domain S-box protein [Candidatus Fermentibacteria bacterium]|nr:PAS domain S-box protein [Candidatus Fermentibacteria bacterium]
MPELAQIYLLETRHFETWVEGFLASKGASVLVCRSMADLPDPGNPRWVGATAIVDIDQTGADGLARLEASSQCVVLTGSSSRNEEVFDRATIAGWEVLIKPYTPEELYFRLTRLWSNGLVWEPPSATRPQGSTNGITDEIIVEAARKLVGCRFARLAEVRDSALVTLAECGDLSGAALVDRVVYPGCPLQGLVDATQPHIVRERLPSDEYELRSRGEVLVAPLRLGRTRAYLLLVQGLDGSPFGAGERHRAAALSTLAGALFSGAGESSFKRTVARLLAHVPSGIMVLDSEGTVFSINRQGVSVLALTEKQALGRDAASLLGLKKDDALVRAIKTGEPAMRMEQKVRLPGGKSMMLGVSVAPIEPDDEVASGSVLVFQDLSGVKRLEERVRRADQLASLGAMAAGMAHEIRNPLASMLTGVQILGSLSPSDPRAKRHTETIVEQITRVNRIVQDLLTLGRPAKSKIEPCPIDKAVAHAVQGMGTRASDQGVTVRLELPTPSPVALMDEAQIQQVLLNLFLNAVEAMPEGGELMVRAGERPETATVRIEVSDTGEGIAPENLGHVFTPFFSTKAQGSGLGLSICNRIISDHNGQLDISSTVGKGTTATLELPCPVEPEGGSGGATALAGRLPKRHGGAS